LVLETVIETVESPLSAAQYIGCNFPAKRDYFEHSGAEQVQRSRKRRWGEKHMDVAEAQGAQERSLY
jgi:hypothetical protein